MFSNYLMLVGKCMSLLKSCLFYTTNKMNPMQWVFLILIGSLEYYTFFKLDQCDSWLFTDSFIHHQSVHKDDTSDICSKFDENIIKPIKSRRCAVATNNLQIIGGVSDSCSEISLFRTVNCQNFRSLLFVLIVISLIAHHSFRRNR